MEFKGTKGNWYVDHEESGTNENGAKYLTISSKLGKAECKGIADVYEDEANAKLIACAPEMLEMLMLIRDKYLTVHAPESVFDELESLIKKATE